MLGGLVRGEPQNLLGESARVAVNRVQSSQSEEEERATSGAGRRFVPSKSRTRCSPIPHHARPLMDRGKQANEELARSVL
jgi:hypothetical protein